MGNNDLIAVGIIGVVLVGGYLWYQNSMGKINKAVNQTGFADKLAGALGPGMAKFGMKWNGSNWVDSKTGRPLTQAQQQARIRAGSK